MLKAINKLYMQAEQISTVSYASKEKHQQLLPFLFQLKDFLLLLFVRLPPEQGSA